MGDHAPGARFIHDPAAWSGRRLFLPQARPGRGSLLHHQNDDRAGGLAGRHRHGNAGAGRRQDRKEAADAALSRPHRELFAARRFIHPRHAHRQDTALPGEGALVPGPQEGGRYQERASAGRQRPELQRRIWRRLLGALYAYRRWLEPRRTQGSRRGHPPTPAAGRRRQQGRHHRRATAENFHRVQPRSPPSA